MQRRNPGPFEPIIYLIQTPSFFRIVGLGGLVLFIIVALGKAAAHGAGAFTLGLVLIAALWLESSLTACRRCRHMGTWHCAGQGILAARLFSPRPPGLAPARVIAHFGLVAIFLLYGLFWVWHGIAAGIVFTLWMPLFLISAIPGQGFSWKSVVSPSAAA
jgi:hypothetical protein